MAHSSPRLTPWAGVSAKSNREFSLKPDSPARTRAKRRERRAPERGLQPASTPTCAPAPGRKTVCLFDNGSGIYRAGDFQDWTRRAGAARSHEDGRGTVLNPGHSKYPLPASALRKKNIVHVTA